MATPIGNTAARDEATIRDSVLRTVYNGFIANGLQAPNILPGSELYIRATAFARQLTVTEANAVISSNAQMPDSAQGDYLLRWLSLLGYSLRDAGPSAGNITITSSQSTTISAGTFLVDKQGLLFKTTKTGIYKNQQAVPIVAVDGGVATNHENGDVLTWKNAPAFCAPTVVVGLPGGKDGLVGGVDQESAENARLRMIFRFRHPMGGGNWVSVADLGASSSPIVQQTFVYPAANGPGTVHVAVVAYASTIEASNARNRDVDSAVMNGSVIPFITGGLAEYAEVVVTTVVNQPVDVALGLTLPSAKTASPPGPGGGWIDGAPWPTVFAGGTHVNITGVSNTTTFSCDAQTPPVDGVSHVAWLDPATWVLNTAVVVGHSGSPGSYTLAIDTPWPNLPSSFLTYAGGFLFPQAENQDAYIAAFLQAFANLGPGEKTNSAGLISRAARKPLPNTAFPYALDNSMLQAVTDSGPEVAATSFLYRSVVFPYTPDLPASINGAPSIFVPKNLAWYAV